MATRTSCPWLVRPRCCPRVWSRHTRGWRKKSELRSQLISEFYNLSSRDDRLEYRRLLAAAERSTRRQTLGLRDPAVAGRGRLHLQTHPRPGGQTTEPAVARRQGRDADARRR